MSTATPERGRHDTNAGFHPPAKNDAPATRSMLLIILFLLALGSVIAVVIHNQYNRADSGAAPMERTVPPPAP